MIDGGLTQVYWPWGFGAAILNLINGHQTGLHTIQVGMAQPPTTRHSAICHHCAHGLRNSCTGLPIMHSAAGLQRC